MKGDPIRSLRRTQRSRRTQYIELPARGGLCLPRWSLPIWSQGTLWSHPTHIRSQCTDCPSVTFIRPKRAFALELTPPHPWATASARIKRSSDLISSDPSDPSEGSSARQLAPRSLQQWQGSCKAARLGARPVCSRLTLSKSLVFHRLPLLPPPPPAM
jgi:hypothetical protein